MKTGWTKSGLTSRLNKSVDLSAYENDFPRSICSSRQTSLSKFDFNLHQTNEWLHHYSNPGNLREMELAKGVIVYVKSKMVGGKSKRKTKNKTKVKRKNKTTWPEQESSFCSSWGMYFNKTNTSSISFPSLVSLPVLLRTRCWFCRHPINNQASASPSHFVFISSVCSTGYEITANNLTWVVRRSTIHFRRNNSWNDLSVQTIFPSSGVKTANTIMLHHTIQYDPILNRVQHYTMPCNEIYCHKMQCNGTPQWNQ